MRPLTMAAAAAALLGLAGSAPAQTLDGLSWDEIEARAREEGTLTWYVWYLKDDLRRFARAFTEETGIAVVIPEGTLAGNVLKLLAERRRGTGDIDVFSAGFDAFETLPAHDLFRSLDMLPPDEGRVRSLAGFDGGDRVLAFWGNQTGIAYDPARIDAAALPQTPEDFAAFWTANPGRFGFNHENGGAGPSFFLSAIGAVAGLDYAASEAAPGALEAAEAGYAFFNAHAEDYVITASNADGIIRVSDGELWMVPAWEDHLAGLQNRGEVRADLAFYIPRMGMFGGGNGVAIPANARHPAAAAVFVDWLTSPETQAALNARFGTAPMHEDAVASDALVPAAQRANSRPWVLPPLRTELENRFVDEVILER